MLAKNPTVGMFDPLGAAIPDRRDSTTLSRLARKKTDEIMMDIDDMQRARDIVSTLGQKSSSYAVLPKTKRTTTGGMSLKVPTKEPFQRTTP